MKFFIPNAPSPQEAEHTWEAVRKFEHEQTGWPVAERRIYRLRYRHDGQDLVAEVGQPDALTGETVIAILSSHTYLVCTLTRGVARGEPILVGKNEVYEVEDFEADNEGTVTTP